MYYFVEETGTQTKINQSRAPSIDKMKVSHYCIPNKLTTKTNSKPNVRSSHGDFQNIKVCETVSQQTY